MTSPKSLTNPFPASGPLCTQRDFRPLWGEHPCWQEFATVWLPQFRYSRVLIRNGPQSLLPSSNYTIKEFLSLSNMKLAFCAFLREEDYKPKDKHTTQFQCFTLQILRRSSSKPVRTASMQSSDSAISRARFPSCLRSSRSSVSIKIAAAKS